MSGRKIFWSLFLLAAAGFGRHFWVKNEPYRSSPLFVPTWTKINLQRLGHPHPKVAGQAWRELSLLYNTKWDAVDMIQSAVDDPREISFLIKRVHRGAGGQGAPEPFWAEDKPIFYKSDAVHCRTARQALLAIIYNEKRWKSDYSGDWDSWWEANKAFHRKAG